MTNYDEGASLLERLPIHRFDEAIADGVCCVVFKILNCNPCTEVQRTLLSLMHRHPDVSLYEFHVRSLSSKPIEDRFGIGPVPLVIGFRDGKEIARFMGRQSKVEIAKFLTILGG